MIYQGNFLTVAFAQKILPIARAALHGRGQAQCDWVSFSHYNAVLSDVNEKFQGSETIQIITGLDSSVTAAIVFNF